MGTPAPLSVHVLGPLRVQRDGRDIALSGPGRRAVLLRLALARGAVVSTDLLIEDLWAGEPPPKALAALQVHVSNLRKILEPDRRPRTPAGVLVSSFPGYALALPVHAVDAWHIESLVNSALRISDPIERSNVLDDALGLWSGPPYQEVADTSWATPEIARLAEFRRTAIEERARTHLELGESPTAVVADLARYVADNPGRERPAHLLALAQYRAGSQADALETLGRARKYLADELGIDPGPELRSLERDILAQSPNLETPRRPTLPHIASPPPTPTDSFVNCRPDETAAVLGVARAVERGAFEIVWVGGEPGQGKTTLASNVRDELTAGGWTVSWGRCPEVDGTPPGWPWSQVLTALTERLPVPESSARRLRPLVDETGSPLVEPFWLAKALIDYLTTLAAIAPVALVLDDVHRADELTMQILRHVIAARGEARVLVIATYRSSEVSAELDTTWAATAAHGRRQIQLHGLSIDGVAEVARHAGYTDIAPHVVATLAERTDGNPLFVREVARMMMSESAGGVRSAVPDSISDVLRRRITRLPADSVSTLRRASVLGREVDLTVLAAMGDRSEEDLLDELEPAVLAGLLTEPAADRLRFTHALVRETLYDELPLMRRSRIHGSALRVLAERAPHDHASLAHHAVLSATPSTARSAVPYAVDAARQASALGSHREALTLWHAAAELHEQAIDGTDSELLDILVPYVGSLARAGDTAGARRERSRAVALASSIGRGQLVRALTSWTAPVVWSIRQDTELDRSIVDPLESLLSGADLDPGDRALLLVALVFEIEGDDVASTIAMSTEAVTLARLADDNAVLCRALNAYGYTALGPDLAHELPAIADDVLKSAGTDSAFRSLGHYYAFLSHCAATELDAADLSAAAVIQCATGHQLGEMLGVVRVYDAVCDLASGHTERALTRYTEAAERMTADGSAIAHFIVMIGRLGAATYLGDLTPMVAELSAIENIRPQSVRFPLIVALLDSGNLALARELWSDAAPYNRDYYWLGMTTYAAHAAARLGDIEASRLLHAHLRPFSGRIAGLDSGAFYAGTVDSALSATAGLLGDDAAAEKFASSSDSLIARLRQRARPS